MVIEYFLEWVETASVAKRTEAASALVRAYLSKDISVGEKEDVEAALTTLLEDPAPCVRGAMAESFGARKSAPKHIISALAEDVIDVSIITLSQSPVLHDAELIECLKSTEIDNQIAISCRPWMSDVLLRAISSHGCKEACMALLMNPVANFAQDSLHVIAQRFGEITDMRLLLLERDDLAAETRLILINKVGEALSGMISEKGWLSQPRAEKVINEACDKASITFVANASNDDVKHLVSSMLQNGRITVNYLMRAVCMGNISLVAHAFSELSGIRLSRVESILTKDHKSAFKALYNRAGLPETAFTIFHCAISSWRRILAENEQVNPSRMAYLVTREILETYGRQKDVLADELVLLLRKLSSEMARASSKVKAAEIASRAAEAQQFIEVQPEPEITLIAEQVEEIEQPVETEEITHVDQTEINTDLLVAYLENDLQNMEAEVEFEVQGHVANDQEIVVLAAGYDYEQLSVIEDDYRPDISEAIMNVAMSGSMVSKAA